MDLTQVINVLSIPYVVAIFGITWAVWIALTQKGVNKAPDWFIFIPAGLGIFLGYMDYFVVTGSVGVKANVWYINLFAATLRSWMFAGAAVILWEMSKAIWSMIGKNNAPEVH